MAFLSGERIMTSKGKRALLNKVLLGASLYVFDAVRRHLAENIKRTGVKPKEKSVDPRAGTSGGQSEASQRLEHDDTILANSRRFLDTVGPAIIWIGVGVGIGVILAPASGEETRRNIEERVRDRFFETKAA
jgi:hypothetical protein